MLPLKGWGRGNSIRDSRAASVGVGGLSQVYTVGVLLCSTEEDRAGEARPKPGRAGRRALQRFQKRISEAVNEGSSKAYVTTCDHKCKLSLFLF